ETRAVPSCVRTTPRPPGKSTVSPASGLSAASWIKSPVCSLARLPICPGSRTSYAGRSTSSP
ncbi:T-box protein VegT, partial [Clarias magur]